MLVNSKILTNIDTGERFGTDHVSVAGGAAASLFISAQTPTLNNVQPLIS
jgi:hypothetical protein